MQIITDVPHFGGASGSTLNEAKSWGKVSVDADSVTVHADATLALPLLATALAGSAKELIAARRPPCFELDGQAMVIDDVRQPAGGYARTRDESG